MDPEGEGVTPLTTIRVHLVGLWKWLGWQFKPAWEKAHILQMRYDPAYRRGHLERVRKRQIYIDAYRELGKLSPPHP